MLDFDGKLLKRVRPHSAMVNDLSIDNGSDFVGSASMDGKPHSGRTSAEYLTDRVFCTTR